MMIKRNNYLLTLLFCCGITSSTYADTYLSTDANGVTVLSNTPSSNATSFTSDDNSDGVPDAPVNGITNSQSTAQVAAPPFKASNQSVKVITPKSSTPSGVTIPVGTISASTASEYSASPKPAATQAAYTPTAKSVVDINNQIKQINKDLSTKQVQKQQLDSALKGSQDAINKTAQLLKQLKAKQDADLNQIAQLQQTIPQITNATNQAKDLVAKSTAQIYGQIKLIEAQKQSILSGNDSLDSSRKQEYLIQILKAQNVKYTELNNKLTDLQNLNIRLQDEVARLSKKMDDASKKHQNLMSNLTVTQQKTVAVQQQIQQEQSKLANLKQRQAELNQLLKQLAQKPAKKATKSAGSSNSQAINLTNADQSAEDNSPFMSRTIVQPVGGSISVGFGQMRDSVKNNGVLLTVADNSPVLSVSNGMVLFSGELPGFGNIVVVDNGDNYTSVYSGVISQLKKGTKVTPGQKIASTGTSANQPMGGFYFELRHLGKPVNPTKLFTHN